MTIYVGPRVSSATGGSISTISGFTVHTFSNVGVNTFIPSTTGYVEVFTVGAGGGGGNSFWSGGGGGGSVLYQKFIPVLSGVAYTMFVGSGGASFASGQVSTCTYNGGSITAPGGGGENISNPLGSGGGGAANKAATIGAGVIGLGFPGGLGTPSAISSPSSIGAGGGGAGGSGQNGRQSGVPVTPTTGRGGPGVPYSITGVSTYYGGGGSGVNTTGHPNNSPTNFGLGGVGNVGGPGDGNPGVVIIRYIT